MSFKLIKTLDGAEAPLFYNYSVPASTAIAQDAVLSLTVSGNTGYLEPCTGTNLPFAVAQAALASTGSVTTQFPVVVISDNQIWQTTANATLAQSVVGSKVTLDGTYGSQCTATTTSGTFEVLSTDGVTGGGVVTGRFTSL